MGTSYHHLTLLVPWQVRRHSTGPTVTNRLDPFTGRAFRDCVPLPSKGQVDQGPKADLESFNCFSLRIICGETSVRYPTKTRNGPSRNLACCLRNLLGGLPLHWIFCRIGDLKVPVDVVYGCLLVRQDPVTASTSRILVML